MLALDPENPIAREGLKALQADVRAAEPAPAATPAAETAPTWPVLRYEEGVAVYACAYHPDRETTLRCNRCGKPICPDCAVLTDVGYRCPECVRALEGRFYRATPQHVITSLVAAAGLGLVAGVVGVLVAAFIGFWSILVAPALAGAVAEGIWRAGARHRARHLNLYAALVVTVTGLLGVVVGLAFFPHGWLFGLIALAVTVITVYSRLR